MNYSRSSVAVAAKAVERWRSRAHVPPKSQALRDVVPLICSFLIAAGLAFNGLNDAVGKAVSAVLGGALLLLMLMMKQPDQAFWQSRRAVLLPAALAGVWLTLGASGVSLGAAPTPFPFDPDFAAVSLLAWFGGLAALIAGSIAGSHEAYRRRVLQLIAFFIAFVLLAGLVLLFSDVTGGVFEYWTITRRDRFAGLTGNANVTAAIAVALVFIALGNVRDAAGGASSTKQLLAIGSTLVVSAIGVLAALLTAARFPIVAGGGVLAFSALMWLSPNGARRRWSLTVGVAFAAILIAAFALYSNALFARFETIGNEAVVRELMWHHYAALAMESPLQGYGPGSFTALNRAHLETPKLGLALWFVNSPHSLPIQLILEGGFVYLLLMGAAAVMLLRDVLPVFLTQKVPAEAIGLGSAVLIIFLCAAVDITLDVPAVALLAMFLAGLLWGLALTTSKSPQR